MSVRICVSLLIAASHCQLATGKTDYAAERQHWEQLAQMGDAPAQYRLAGFYQNGWGVTLDYETAETTPNQDSPLTAGRQPLFGLTSGSTPITSSIKTGARNIWPTS